MGARWRATGISAERNLTAANINTLECHQKEGGNSVGIHNNNGRDTTSFPFTVARQSTAIVQSLAPEVIAKRTKRHLDELEARTQ